MNYHGISYSHIDALCHIIYNQKMYNRHSKDLVKPNGAEKLGINNMKHGIFTRGVLVDIPKLKGKSYLEPDETIMPAYIESCEEETGLKIKSGDALFIRTGRSAYEKEDGQWEFSKKHASLHPTMAKWLKERDVAVLGSDGVISPIHEILLAGL
jgi:kynurenine formamidase